MCRKFDRTHKIQQEALQILTNPEVMARMFKKKPRVPQVSVSHLGLLTLLFSRSPRGSFNHPVSFRVKVLRGGRLDVLNRWYAPL
jgi:hypothetical protein